MKKQTAAAPAAGIQNVRLLSGVQAARDVAEDDMDTIQVVRCQEMPLNCVCSPEQKACTFEVLVVSFLNQGHLFLSGKREMFLKARLSIKSIGCHGYHLPHRTALRVQQCDFLYSKVQHCQKKKKTFSVVYLEVHYGEGDK